MKSRRKTWIVPLIFIGLLSVGVVVIAQAPAQVPVPPPAQTAPQNPPPTTPPPPDPTNPDEQKYKIGVNVELVNVVATVLDESSKYMDGLRKEDFKIFEDGQEQAISFFSHDLRVPVSVGVLVDTSGSMKHKLQQALQTVREISMALSPQDEVFFVSFASDVEVRQKFTNNSTEIQKSLKDLKAGGETAAYDAISVALQEMKRAKHTKKVVILITDGFDTKSRINQMQVMDQLKHSDVLVYAIGIDDDDNDPYILRREKYHIYHYMLNNLTAPSGGRAYRMFTGRTFALQTVAQLLLDELHQQYTLSYYPTSSREGNAWHQVEVKVSKPGSQIRHKTGYFVNLPGNSNQ